ncbi:hypothetical protein PV326_013404 [Microctonus aethiopoides]|nr:hypothetical protein PV326_013404 [Microctonus aethiopoides]
MGLAPNKFVNLETSEVNPPSDSILVPSQTKGKREDGYLVKLEIDNCRAIKNVSYTCVYNKSDRCKHVASLVRYDNHEENWSKTDQDQQWGKPSARRLAKDKYSKGKYFCEMFSCSNEFNVMGEAQVHTTNLVSRLTLKLRPKFSHTSPLNIRY